MLDGNTCLTELSIVGDLIHVFNLISLVGRQHVGAQGISGVSQNICTGRQSRHYSRQGTLIVNALVMNATWKADIQIYELQLMIRNT